MVDEFIKEHTGKKKSCCGICKKHKNQQDIDSFLKMKNQISVALSSQHPSLDIHGNQQIVIIIKVILLIRLN